MLFGKNERAVSPVIGAILLFGLAIAVLATIQSGAVPAQNKDVEFQHYLETQKDLKEVRSSILDAGPGGGTESVTMQLGAQYPSRMLLFNRPPASGYLRTESVGGGEIRSHGPVNFSNVCGLGETDSVDSKHLVFSPNYNYLETNGTHVYENTVLYQRSTDGGQQLTRSGQAFIRPGSKTISIYPLVGNLSESTSRAVSVEFVGSEVGKKTYSGPNLTVPSRINKSQWESMIPTDSPTIRDSGDDVNFDFSGEWTVRCQPIGINEAPNQTVNPYNEDERTEPIAPSRSLGFINPAGDGVVSLTGMESGELLGLSTDIGLQFTNNANQTKTWDEARLAFYSGGGDVSVLLNGNSQDELRILKDFEEVQEDISIAPGATEAVGLDPEGGFTLSGEYAVLQVKYEDGSVRTYFMGSSGTLGLL